jgi:hypothetical protein
MTSKVHRIQTRLEYATRRWWFFLLIVLSGSMIPPYLSKGYDWSDIGSILGTIFSQAIIDSLAPFYPIFRIIPIVLIICIILLHNKVTRVFSIYVAITYVLFAIVQNIAITDEYGLAIVTGNIVMFLVVAGFWIWEAKACKNEFMPIKRPVWRYWVVPLAFLAFWYPLNPDTMRPDFSPLYLLTSGAGLTFCMMTPVYLAILTLYYPKVNIATMRVTALVGIIIAIYNVLLNFFIEPDLLWWNGVLHIPLLCISGYSLGLSLKKRPIEQ